MENCIFCKIIKKEIPSKLEFESDSLIVFQDIHPKAKIHLLLVPKKHYKDVLEAPDGLWLEMKKIAKVLAKERKVDGFRLVTNAGESAEVPHMHMHFLGHFPKDADVSGGFKK